MRGAAQIIAIDSDPFRLSMARKFGATSVMLSEVDAVSEFKELTGNRGVDVAIEAIGFPETFAKCMQALRPGGTLSSVGVYSDELTIPKEAFLAGLGDHKIVTTLCPGGKERMQRLLRLVETGRIDLRPLITHTFPLDRIEEAYKLFAERKTNVLKVAIRVSGP